jgi:hypothetical protein
MNTKLLMTSSAVSLAMIGLACSFIPHEILAYFGVVDLAIFPLILQILGALYLGFALLNWTAKANLIGGIYSKPVAIGNFMHYMVGSLALFKFFIAHTDLNLILIPTVIYTIFALLFGKVTFGNPV